MPFSENSPQMSTHKIWGNGLPLITSHLRCRAWKVFSVHIPTEQTQGKRREAFPGNSLAQSTEIQKEVALGTVQGQQ